MKYLIWSVERSMWWKEFRLGYTEDIEFAGRYSKEDAFEILENANITGIEEYMLLAPECN